MWPFSSWLRLLESLKQASPRQAQCHVFPVTCLCAVSARVCGVSVCVGACMRTYICYLSHTIQGGATREHALLAFTLGVRQMVVAVNKVRALCVSLCSSCALVLFVLSAHVVAVCSVTHVSVCLWRALVCPGAINPAHVVLAVC